MAKDRTAAQQGEVALNSLLDEEVGGGSSESDTPSAPTPATTASPAPRSSESKRAVIQATGDEDYVFQDPEIEQDLKAALRRIQAATQLAEAETRKRFRKEDEDAVKAAEAEEEAAIRALTGHLTGVHAVPSGSPPVAARAAVPPVPAPVSAASVATPPAPPVPVSRQRVNAADAAERRRAEQSPPKKEKGPRLRDRMKSGVKSAGEYLGIGGSDEEEANS